MSDRKLLYTFQEQWRAELLQNLLKSEGIESLLVRGAREYSSIVTGIGEASEELFVDEIEFERAQLILSQFLSPAKNHLHVVEIIDTDKTKISTRVKILATVLLGRVLFCAGLYYVFVALR